MTRGEAPNTPQMSEEQKDGLRRFGSKSVFAGIGVGVGGLAMCGLTAGAACPIAVAIVAGAIEAGAEATKGVAEDPPDPNFRVIAEPVTPTLSAQPLKAGDGLTLQQADAFNAVLINANQETGLSRAILTAFDRESGARNAGNTVWPNRQRQAAQQYAAQLATVLMARVELYANLQRAFEATGIPSQTLNREDIIKYQMEVATNGLPPSKIQVLSELGLDAAKQERIRQNIVNANIEDLMTLGAAEPGSGARFPQMLTDGAAEPGGSARFPQMLTDPSITAAIQEAGQALNEFANSPLPPQEPTRVFLPLVTRK